MRKLLAVVAGLLFLGIALAAERQNSTGNDILEFNTMAPVSGPFRGPLNAIRNIPGAGAPWVISSAEGELKADGKLEVEVRGLVLAATGTNPIANFRGVVSCLTVDETGMAAISNLSTGDFPASSIGDAKIEANLELPSQCIAPIVFVIIPPSPTRPNGAWLAVTGR